VEDLSYDEVSGVLAIPVTLVVSRVEQARRQMSERLRQELDFAAVTARLREGRSSRHVETG
jgi:DNA-directed RNA polymerase specialized sigma24 family protein